MLTRFVPLLSFLAFLVTASHPAASEDLPKTIRIAASGSAGYDRAGGYMGILQEKRFLENEFKADGIKIEWNLVDGAGPAQTN